MSEYKFKIAVALATYNGENYLTEQLNSIINQTIKVDAIFIGDDNSNDSTDKIISNIIKKYPEENIIYYKNIVRLGSTQNFNTICKHITDDYRYIFFSDQDDIWCNDKVESSIEIAEKEKVSLVFSDAYIIDNNGEYLDFSLWESYKIFKNEWSKVFKTKQVLKTFLRRNLATGATMCVRYDLLNIALDFPEAWVHDYWIAIIAALNDKSIYPIDKKLILYRQHENQQIGTGVSKKKNALEFSKEDRNNRIASHFIHIESNMRLLYQKYSESGINRKYLEYIDLGIYYAQLKTIFAKDNPNRRLVHFFKQNTLLLLKAYSIYNSNGIKGLFRDFYVFIGTAIRYSFKQII
ncbi:MAG: glycosyltransferase [Mobilitalea sp.]